jgi:hypothetical protein
MDEGILLLYYCPSTFSLTSPSPLPKLNVQYIHVQKACGCDKGVGPGPTLAWPGWKQPDIPVEVDTGRLETSRSEAGVLKK